MPHRSCDRHQHAMGLCTALRPVRTAADDLYRFTNCVRITRGSDSSDVGCRRGDKNTAATYKPDLPAEGHIQTNLYLRVLVSVHAAYKTSLQLTLWAPSRQDMQF